MNRTIKFRGKRGDNGEYHPHLLKGDDTDV